MNTVSGAGNRSTGTGPPANRAEKPGAANPAGQAPPRATGWIAQGLETLVRQHPSMNVGQDGVADLTADDLTAHFDVLVVGSGYGAAVVAQALAGRRHARSGQALRVCVLERGHEHLAGSFASGVADLPGELRFATPGAQRASGAAEGLFDLRLGPDVNVLLANGLGGGSLINAGVMEMPLEAVFAEPRWPTPLRGEVGLRERGHALRKRLGAVPAKPSRKGQVLQRLASCQSFSASATPHITIAQENGTNSAGVWLNACVGCGDCATGCNHNAKDSLDLNLLRQAALAGAVVVTGATVLRVAPAPAAATTAAMAASTATATAAWLVEVNHTEHHARKRQRRPFVLRAHHVVLAAGSLGSTEILMRSTSKSLQLSAHLGSHFSANGDMIAAAHGLRVPVQAVADEAVAAHQRGIGPTITHMLDLRESEQAWVMQDLAVPAALRRLYAESFVFAQTLQQLSTADTRRHDVATTQHDSAAVSESGLQRSMVVALITRDGACGELRLPPVVAATNTDPQAPGDGVGVGDGILGVHWPDLKNDSRLASAHAAFKQMHSTADIGGYALANPVWKPLSDGLEQVFGSVRGPLLTVHPLGGCVMGNGPQDGVVDHAGRVFDAAHAADGREFHAGLYVVCGAIVPCSLGINPALTIATLAERAVQQWALPGGWLADWLHPGAIPKAATSSPLPAGQQQARPRFCDAPLPAAEQPTQLQVIEQMQGRVFLQHDSLASAGHTLQLTMSFEPQAVKQLMHPSASQRRLHLRPERGQLKLMGPQGQVLLTAQIGGTVHLFGLEASGPGTRRLRAAWAWWLNRGFRDLSQGLVRGVRQRLGDAAPVSANAHGASHGPVNALSAIWAMWVYGCRFWRLFSHAGAVRLLDYRFTINQVQVHAAAKGELALQAASFEGQRLWGHKRFAYTPAGNPWLQLQDLHLQAMPLLQPTGWWAALRQLPRALPLALASWRAFSARYLQPAVISFNPAYAAAVGVPLLRVVKQPNRVAALADLAAFSAYVLRITLQVHGLSLRQPDPPRAREPRRLPGQLAGLPPPQIDWLHLPPTPGFADLVNPVGIRLARYRSAAAAAAAAAASETDGPAAQPPVLLIHGYSASGTTFAHDAIPGHLVGVLCAAGRDVWVLDMRSSAGLPTATQPWCFEDMAGADIPLAFAHVLRATGAKQLDVVAHCMGAAMLSMALLDANSSLHQSVGRVVLSQIGPLLQLSPANTLRAHVMHYVRYFLPLQGYAFRPDGAGGEAGGAGALLDRLLATLPYPREAYRAEHRAENPLWPPGKATPWVATRHRMDALYARTFSLLNMPPAVLEHIDDLFGPLNIETASQVIHLARRRAIADHRGFNHWTAPQRLAQKITFPVLSLHGQDNGLADPHTLCLMRQQFTRAGLPHLTALTPLGHCESAREVHLTLQTHAATLQSAGQGSLLTWCVAGHGHQDGLIGRHAPQINGVIAAFLARPA